MQACQDEADNKAYRPYNKNLKPVAQELRTNATKQENHLWYDFLREFRPRFTRQRIVGSYILDFFCPQAMLEVELDGQQHYEEAQINYDHERTAFLRQFDIEVLRFSNIDVEHDWDAVCKKIEETVVSRNNHRCSAPSL